MKKFTVDGVYMSSKTHNLYIPLCIWKWGIIVLGFSKPGMFPNYYSLFSLFYEKGIKLQIFGMAIIGK